MLLQILHNNAVSVCKPSSRITEQIGCLQMRIDKNSSLPFKDCLLISLHELILQQCFSCLSETYLYTTLRFGFIFHFPLVKLHLIYTTAQNIQQFTTIIPKARFPYRNETTARNLLPISEANKPR